MFTVADETLVRRAQKGDQAALSELITRYERKTYNLAYRLMGNHADASDAAQEALVRVYTRLPNFRGDSAFSTWLFRVVTNTCLDELRRRGRLRHQSLDNPLPAEEGALPRQTTDESDGPIERAERREVQAAVQRAINRLPDEYRAVVVMRDLQDLTYHEIAAVLGTSLGTIKSRLHRARQALRLIIRATEAAKLDLKRVAG
ncbi:MAG: polymerase ECF-type sigma factor [Symbiobacteriaceae bacterium]|jgi:RNA polymerase sigma-70 factor (ECF subfamily)|nr:polymerase ECF-type sigma factor [Symbiobacteriaceae bacterium]